MEPADELENRETALLKTFLFNVTYCLFFVLVEKLTHLFLPTIAQTFL